MSSAYEKKRWILTDLEEKGVVLLKCRRCGDIFQVFDYDGAMSFDFCMECEWQLRDDQQRRVYEDTLRVRTTSASPSQSTNPPSI